MQRIDIINVAALFNAAARIKEACTEAMEQNAPEREADIVSRIDLASCDLALAAGRVSTEQHAKAQADIEARAKQRQTDTTLRKL